MVALGVFLSFDAKDFGAPTPQSPTFGSVFFPAGLRTGLSNAAVTDDEDDSYDLGWLRSLSGTQQSGSPNYAVSSTTKLS